MNGWIEGRAGGQAGSLIEFYFVFVYRLTLNFPTFRRNATPSISV